MDAFRGLKTLLTQLPGIGPKSAERIVLSLLKRPPSVSQELGRSLVSLHEAMSVCHRCNAFVARSECIDGVCSICRNPKRDPQQLCVVSETIDQSRIEETAVYQGLYHVLGGTLDPLEGITADNLAIQPFIERITHTPPRELILALNPDIRGETTALYLEQLLASYRQTGGIITKLARGLPSSSTIEYADTITLTDALNGRKKIQNTPGNAEGVVERS